MLLSEDLARVDDRTCLRVLSSSIERLTKLGDFDGFRARMIMGKIAIEKSGLRDALIVHHDEADGLCSGALTKIALEKIGLKTRLVCLDKLYPEVVKDLESGPQQVIAYSDIGSGHIEWITTWNHSKNLILTLDHHDTIEVEDPLVYNLNPELYGYSGERESSSSTVAYLFAKVVDLSLTSFAPLAVIGSDEIPGEARGLNLIPVEDGEKSQKIVRAAKGGLKVQLGVETLSPSRASSILNILGSVGYYRSGPASGINACIDGFHEVHSMAMSLEEERKAANQKMLATIREKRLNQLKNIQWFNAHDTYKGMSGKVVGSFCSYLSYQRLVNPTKYLIGMMNVPADIPGWGKLSSPVVKVSGRVPQQLAKMIENGKRQPLSRILPKACEKLGGFGDGHTVAASGVFPLGAEEKFVKEIDRLAGISVDGLTP